jgi:hypothetical protein
MDRVSALESLKQRRLAVQQQQQPVQQQLGSAQQQPTGLPRGDPGSAQEQGAADTHGTCRQDTDGSSVARTVKGLAWICNQCQAECVPIRCVYTTDGPQLLPPSTILDPCIALPGIVGTGQSRAACVGTGSKSMPSLERHQGQGNRPLTSAGRDTGMNKLLLCMTALGALACLRV